MRFLFSILMALLFADQVAAQQNLRVSANAVSTTSTANGTLYYGKGTEPPRAIEFKERTVTASTFIANINQHLNIPNDFTFTEVESNADNLGMRHHLLQQHYKGIPLEGLVYRVHEKDGFVTSANGRAVRNIKLDPQVKLKEEYAFHLATKYLNTKDTVFRHGKKLIVSKGFTFSPESFSIAYQFDIDVSFIEQWRISIDARDGRIINKVSLVNTCFNEGKPPLPPDRGTGMTNYYGTQSIAVEKYENGSSRLRGVTEHGGKIGTYDFQNVSVLSLLWFFEWHQVYDFYSSTNTYNDPYQRPAVSAQWAAEQAFEYYFTKHNRNSFDNNGSEIKSYVHVDQNFQNAFWTHNLLAFGDGSNNNPLVELDVVAHELTHGVNQYEANLQYYNESGALSESFSDILAKAIEFDTFGDTATWKLARHSYEGGLRDMSNPNLKGQPDTYAGNLWYTGYDDNGGVHYNSGVQNFWFYLLCEGGTGTNDHNLNYAINSIGVEAAASIAYRNLTEYLSYYSDYLDSRIGSMLATADLYGTNSTAYQEVDKAWDAVGVVDEPIITSDLELYDITATTVKIKSSLLPRAATATYHFEYGTTEAFGSSSVTYNYTDKVEGMLTGLESQTKYYVRLVATNENGTTYGKTAQFKTLPLTPLVKIVQTVDVTETTAVFHGEVNPNSLPTSFYFEYGTTPTLGLITATYQLSSATEYLPVSAPVINLQPRQTYYYRLVATNSFASATTESVSFFTASKPVITSFTPASGETGTEVTIIGENFSSIQENNLVSFGATRAVIVSSSSTEIKVIVPVGASLAPIYLLDAESGLSGESIQKFVPTFTGEFKPGSLQLTAGINDPYMYRAKVQDMDGDGKPDIVGTHYQGFSVFQNVNQGGDVTMESFVRNTYPFDTNWALLGIEDFDGNGLKDIFVRGNDNLYRIYPNYSVPGYIFFGAPLIMPTELVWEIVFGDFDMDGRVDVAGFGVSEDRYDLVIYRNKNPKGTLSAENFTEPYRRKLPNSVDYLTHGDLNNDGKDEIMLGVYGARNATILQNNSSPGIFDFEESEIADPLRERFARYISQDLNQDGWEDLASHSLVEGGYLSLFENKKSSPAFTFGDPVIALDGAAQSSIQPGDLTGDGKVDLVVGTDRREFTVLKNKVAVGSELSSSSFEQFTLFGLPVGMYDNVESEITINDLNGDGRPEVITTYNYYYWPHDGYMMEIWNNGPVTCPNDPTLITVGVSNYTATINLPPNTTIDQFDIDYRYAGSPNWYDVYSTTLYLNSGYSYQLRARAKCYLSFTDYYYIDFATECVDINSFAIVNVGVDNAYVTASNLSSFEVQYSLAGQDQWTTLYQYDNQITGLSPGTKYDLRFRGRCYWTTQFQYRQFTTKCPSFYFSIIDLSYNQAKVDWPTNATGDPTLEYSTNRVDWILIDDSRIMYPLEPAKQYFVRAMVACADTTSVYTEQTFTTPCPQVSGLSTDNVTPFSALIKWTDESKTGSYVLTYAQFPGGTVTTLETNSTSIVLNGLQPGGQYDVQVAPQCTGTKVFTPLTFWTICYTATNLSANDITYTTAELSWNDDFGGLPYLVQYSVAESKVWLSTETSSTSLFLDELRPATEYEVRIHISCLSVKKQHASLKFKTRSYEQTTLAPNPTDGMLTIRPSKDLIGNRYSIQDSAGRIIVDSELSEYTIDLSYFAAGLYILRIEGEDPVRIVKY